MAIISWTILRCARVGPGAALAAMLAIPGAAWAESPLRVGFGQVEITPDVKGPQPVWLAGYGNGRRASGVHDPLYARCVLLEHEGKRLALVSVDLVGLQYPTVKKVRQRLPSIDYVMVSSTHNHEGPDVIGIWGQTPLQRGVDDKYLQQVEDRLVQLVARVAKQLVEAKAEYGTAEDASLLNDSRQPIAKDPVLRVLRFRRVEDERPVGILVQWNSHPEAMGSKNTLVTADFPAGTIQSLVDRHRCPVAYFTGAVGGLMAPPRGRIMAEDGTELKEGDLEYAKRYGQAVAGLADQALHSASPIRLTPLVVSAKSIALPVHNPLYRAVHSAGVLRRPAFQWTGDEDKIGPPMKLGVGQTMAVETEVAYLRLGELGVACIPGELYPELVYGKFQEPADPAADYPQAPLEPTIVKSLPEQKWLLFGLANDEVGYIIPRRQWDNDSPFAYGRKKPQYGEVNSCSTFAAPIIMSTLQQRVREVPSSANER